MAAVRAGQLLRDYRAKRDFASTLEPAGKVRGNGKTAAGAGIFVVQQHDATRMHWDFRLELDGVLKSWAVTRGPSDNPADKRLAVRVEDHPLDYAHFEGTIPQGQYGGGTVMLWDEGTWEPIGDPHEGLEKGDLKFVLHGQRMKGEWVLVHMKGRDGGGKENWLLIKHRDAYSHEANGEALVEKNTTSVETGRDLEGIARGLKSRKASTKSEVWTHGKAVALPEFEPPQLATLVDAIPQGSGWVFEMKYDGYRCLAAIAGEDVRLFTRNGNDWTTQFSVLREPLSRLTGGSALIDGEICAFDAKGRTDFSTLKAALSSGGALVYFVFDLLEIDGEDLRDKPLVERKARLEKLIGKVEASSPIQFSQHVEGNGQKVLDALCAAGHEGVIAKRADAPYRGERSKTWLKIKCLKRQEFVIGGWRPSEKKKTFASLLLGAWDNDKFVYHGRVGTGFSERDAAALQAALDKRARKTSPFVNAPRDIARRANWVEPDLVAEIAYSEVTPDGALRHPSFIGLREDKPAHSVTMEIASAPPDTGSAGSGDKPVQHLDPAKGEAVAEKLGVRLTSPERVAYPGQGVTKGELVAYYDAVSEAMLPYIVDRPLSLVRCPQGRSKYCFFQKHDTGGFPPAMKTVEITEKDGSKESYFYVSDLSGIVAAVQMNTLEFHLWGSRRDKIELPERVIFDIDPDEGLNFTHVREAAADIREGLRSWGLESFALLTGGKGVHVVAPIARRADWALVKLFCKTFAQRMAEAEPERFTTALSKAKRKGKMFIDYLRNERGSTAIAPYSTRSREGAPVATPVTWEELGAIERANAFSLPQAAERAKGPDPWKEYFSVEQSITKGMVNAVAGPLKKTL